MKQREFVFHEENEFFKIELPKQSLKYVDYLLRQPFCGELLGTGFYPSCKEISETVGVFNAARWHLELDWRDPKVLAVVVGDGISPRTGLYMHFLSRWGVVSVDPAMESDVSHWNALTKLYPRLSILPNKIEECQIDCIGYDAVVLLYVHSHASLLGTLPSLKFLGQHVPTVGAISLPCCYEDDLGIEPNKEFVDWHIISVKRNIRVYKNLDKSFFFLA